MEIGWRTDMPKKSLRRIPRNARIVGVSRDLLSAGDLVVVDFGNGECACSPVTRVRVEGGRWTAEVEACWDGEKPMEVILEEGIVQVVVEENSAERLAAWEPS